MPWVPRGVDPRRAVLVSAGVSLGRGGFVHDTKPSSGMTDRGGIKADRQLMAAAGSESASPQASGPGRALMFRLEEEGRAGDRRRCG